MSSDLDIASRLKQHFSRLMENLPPIPEGVHWLLPLQELPESSRVFHLFLEKYYADHKQRSLLLGINPGRFGAGLTNVAFTDPVHLERNCGIANDFPKREEFSAQFIYKVIDAFGGPSAFYGHFFINSLVPFGFVKDGKNYNYYDDKPLQEAMEAFTLFHIRGLLEMGMNRERCFCLGEGKNFKIFSKLNAREKLFGSIVPLPHPRFVMQYRRARLEEYIQKYTEELSQGL